MSGEIKEIKDELRILHSRITDEANKSSRSFKELIRKHDDLLDRLNKMLVPVGIMGTQVARNESDIKQAKIETSKDNDELKDIMGKWEARMFKFLIAFVSAILLAIIIHFMKNGMP